MSLYIEEDVRETLAKKLKHMVSKIPLEFNVSSCGEKAPLYVDKLIVTARTPQTHITTLELDNTVPNAWNNMVAHVADEIIQAILSNEIDVRNR